MPCEYTRYDDALYGSKNLNLNAQRLMNSVPLNINEEMTFTTWAEGGEQPYLWEFSVYKDEEIYYHEEYIANVFEWIPMETGVYKAIVRVTDSTGYSTSYSKDFSIN